MLKQLMQTSEERERANRQLTFPVWTCSLQLVTAWLASLSLVLKLQTGDRSFSALVMGVLAVCAGLSVVSNLKNWADRVRNRILHLECEAIRRGADS